MQHIDVLLSESIENKQYVEQVKWLLAIFEWVRLPKDLQNHKIPKDKVYSVRIKHLLLLLNKNPQWKINFISSISSIIIKMSSIKLFTESGLSLNASFIQEAIRRLEEKFIPQAALTDDLSSLLLELFPDEDESVLVDNIDETIFTEVLELFKDSSPLIHQLLQNLTTSIQILSIQLLSNTLIINRELDISLKDHQEWPESKLVFSLNSATDLYKPQILEYLSQVEKNLDLSQSKMQDHGIKIDLVFLIESQKRRLDRLRLLFNILSTESSKLHIRHFLSQLILDIHHQSSLKSFMTENLSLLSKQIVSQNSHLGEHYVTYNWADFFHMFRAAIGGGAFTTLTVFIKLFISNLAISGFIKGLSEGLNYALSFLSIQAFGWTLATKQPSTTAPFLANSLRNSLSEAKTAILAIIRTQFIAVTGNLALVMPLSFLISLLMKSFDYPLTTVEKANYMFNSTNILGPSFIFAMFTGVLLFLSSIIAGWFDNWMTLHQLPERISNHQKLINFFGLAVTKKISDLLKKHANPIAANISLGMLLGFTPQYLKFMGIPLEVRHITLSAGNFAASLPFINFESLSWIHIADPILGLLLIGILNIAVSFSLALALAAISSQIPFKRLWNILSWGLQVVVTKPWLLLIPAKDQKSN